MKFAKFLRTHPGEYSCITLLEINSSVSVKRDTIFLSAFFGVFFTNIHESQDTNLRVLLDTFLHSLTFQDSLTLIWMGMVPR